MPGFLNSIINDARPRSTPVGQGDRLPMEGPGNARNHTNDVVPGVSKPQQANASTPAPAPKKNDHRPPVMDPQPDLKHDNQSIATPVKDRQVDQGKGPQSDTSVIANQRPQPPKAHEAPYLDQSSPSSTVSTAMQPKTPYKRDQASTGQDKPSSTRRHSFIEEQGGMHELAKKVDEEKRPDRIKNLRSETDNTAPTAAMPPKVAKLQEIIPEPRDTSAEPIAMDAPTTPALTRPQPTDQAQTEQAAGHENEAAAEVSLNPSRETESAQGEQIQLTMQNLSSAIDDHQVSTSFEQPAQDHKSGASVTDNTAKIHIGQIDIIVQSEAKPPAPQPPAQPNHSGFSSRNYLRRL